MKIALNKLSQFASIMRVYEGKNPNLSEIHKQTKDGTVFLLGDCDLGDQIVDLCIKACYTEHGNLVIHLSIVTDTHTAIGVIYEPPLVEQAVEFLKSLGQEF